MKLHVQTIERCDRLYRTKAHAYFYGLSFGLLCGSVIGALAVAIAIRVYP